MATGKSTTKKPSNSASKSLERAEIKKSDDGTKEEIVQASTMIPKKIDPNQYITVRNGFQGTLVYKSKRTGETFVWDAFGDEQEMELIELKNARNSSKGFFINNWFMFDDEPWVIDYLGVGQYYKNAIPIKDFDRLFEKPADEVEGIISKLSNGQKSSVAYRAKQLIAEGKIDSNKLIATLEKSLGIELIER